MHPDSRTEARPGDEVWRPCPGEGPGLLQHLIEEVIFLQPTESLSSTGSGLQSRSAFSVPKEVHPFPPPTVPCCLVDRCSRQKSQALALGGHTCGVPVGGRAVWGSVDEAPQRADSMGTHQGVSSKGPAVYHSDVQGWV